MNVFFANTVLIEREREAELTFSAECQIGKANKTRWSLTATPAEVGDHPLRLEVRGKDRQLLASADTVVRVAPGDAGSGSEISLLIIGDSLTHASAYPNELARLLSKPPNPAWRMLGTHKPSAAAENVAHEGYGGWTWSRFRTLFDPKAPEPGKLTSSPFVFDAKLDMKRYFDERCGGERPDFITILLGINDCFHPDPEDAAAVEARIETMIVEAEQLLAAIRYAAPDAEIGICLTTPGNTRDEAFFANYKDRYTRWGWRRIQHRLVEREIAQFGSRQGDRIHLVPTQLNLDCDAGYPDNNGVHPNLTGYSQIAAAIYSWLKFRLATP